MPGDFRGDRQIFEVPCSKCGKTARVPFKPATGKPVYCTDCYQEIKGRR